MRFKISLLLISFVLFTSTATAQKTEITISFNEQFFEALLDAVFQYAPPSEISLSAVGAADRSRSLGNSFAETAACNENIKLLRESGGKRTSVKFRDGVVVAPIAFSGNYSPPLIGCVPFSGVAEAVVDLQFDERGQRLMARAQVRDVSLNGSGGLGGSLIAKMVQGSIDKKINPIEIIRTDKVSFILPLQNSASVKMKATGFSHEVAGGQLNVRIGYEFLKN